MAIFSLIQNQITIGSIVISMLLSGCGLQSSEPEYTNNIPPNMGNIMGNLYNMGNMVQDENYIYFIAWDQHNPIIMKSNFDGTKKETIYHGSTYNLNLMDGYIYFIDKDNNDAICKINTDGQDKTQLYSGQALNLYLYDNKIYFCNISDLNLYSMDLDGENVMKVSDGQVDMDRIYFSENKIYYIPWGENLNNIYKMDVDGQNKELVYSSNYSESVIRFFVYYDKIIIVTSMGIYKINTLDGTKEEIVQNASIVPYFTNLLGDDFYYRNVGLFHKYNLKTKEDRVISKEKVQYVHLLNNKIFYITENSQYIVMDMDGKNSKIFWEE